MHLKTRDFPRDRRLRSSYSRAYHLMKILILHAIKDLQSLRRTTLNQSFCLLKHAPEHEYSFIA